MSLVAAAPMIVGTAQTAILSTVQRNMTEEQFNHYMDGLRNNPLNQATASACANPTGGGVLGALGYDCHLFDQFDHTVIEERERAAAAAAAAAGVEATDAFNANFEAAWNARLEAEAAALARADKYETILRDEQGTPLYPESPAARQGYPQRIPRPPGIQQKALENEPQRVYNQDDSSKEPQLAIGESASPGLPLMTIGTVAVGGVLIFLWVRRDGQLVN